MNALLLSAGFGRRLSDYVKNKPKCLVKINKKTLLDYWLEILNNKKIDKIIINTHYKHKKIYDFVNNHKLKKKIILSHENKILGSIGTILENKEILNRYNDFFVAHSDNFTSFDLNQFLNFHYKKKNKHTVMTFDTKNFKSSGIFHFENNKIKYYQKSNTYVRGPANASIFIFNKSILKLIYKKKKIKDISEDLIPLITKSLNFYHNTNIMLDIGTKKNLIKARNYFYK